MACTTLARNRFGWILFISDPSSSTSSVVFPLRNPARALPPSVPISFAPKFSHLTAGLARSSCTNASTPPSRSTFPYRSILVILDTPLSTRAITTPALKLRFCERSAKVEALNRLVRLLRKRVIPSSDGISPVSRHTAMYTSFKAGSYGHKSASTTPLLVLPPSPSLPSSPPPPPPPPRFAIGDVSNRYDSSTSTALAWGEGRPLADGRAGAPPPTSPRPGDRK
mmetsp:Transcript_30579/g.79779  ORF Transcript_30579/g.79779 Transcript_30579/m.79779 type:complete len:224 (+) Transcript_30579:3793-4464(+)